MTAMARRRIGAGTLLAASLLLFSCSSSNAPQAGTPAFYWAAAKQTYNAGDYQKTIENLGNILAGQNDYVDRARPWMLVLTSGMSHGYSQLGDAYDEGSHTNRVQSTAFHRQVNTYRDFANQLALQFAETFAKFQPAGDYVTLAFPYPTGSPTEVALLNRISHGFMPPDPEIDTAQRRAIERAVLLDTCRAVGAPDDPGKAQDLLKTGEAKVPKAAFVQAMAAALFEDSQIYTRDKLDEPDKLKIFCDRAQAALQSIPASKETEDLDKKIKAALKKAKA
jgi:hypothetical protein